MCSQYVLYTVTGGAVILAFNLDEHANRVAPSAVVAEGFGRYGKPGRQPQKLPTGQVVGNMIAGEPLLDLAQQAQADGDKRQDNADDRLAAQQAAGDDQALLLEGSVLGGLLLVRKTCLGVAACGPLVVGELDAGAQAVSDM